MNVLHLADGSAQYISSTDPTDSGIPGPSHTACWSMFLSWMACESSDVFHGLPFRTRAGHRLRLCTLTSGEPQAPTPSPKGGRRVSFAKAGVWKRGVPWVGFATGSSEGSFQCNGNSSTSPKCPEPGEVQSVSCMQTCCYRRGPFQQICTVTLEQRLSECYQQQACLEKNSKSLAYSLAKTCIYLLLRPRDAEPVADISGGNPAFPV